MAMRNRGTSVWLKVWLVIATRRHSKHRSGGALGPGDNELKLDFGHIRRNDLQTIENITLGLRRRPWLENKCQGQWKAGCRGLSPECPGKRETARNKIQLELWCQDG